MERRDASAVAAAVRWAAALTAAGLALTGCGAGTSTQTSRTAPAITGVDADAGVLALRDLQVDFGETGFYPEGGQAPLRVWIDNQGEEPVVLEAVMSPSAAMVTLATEMLVTEVVDPSPSGGESATPEVDESETPSEDASESPDAADASPTDEPTGDAESLGGEETEVAELVGEADFEIELAPVSYVRLDPSVGSFLLLEGLKEDLNMGSTVEVTFLFSNGEAVTVNLPMGLPAEATSRSYFSDPSEAAAD